MSAFELIRAILTFPTGRNHGRDWRGSFFDDNDNNDKSTDDDFNFSDVDRSKENGFVDASSFDISVGAAGIQIQEPHMFGHIFSEMEYIFESVGFFGKGLPHTETPPHEGLDKNSGLDGGSGNSLRDFMLKDPDLRDPPAVLRYGDPSNLQDLSSSFHHWSFFSRDILNGAQRSEEKKDRCDPPTSMQYQFRMFFQDYSDK